MRQRVEQVRGGYRQFRQSVYGREWVRQSRISLALVPFLLLIVVGIPASDPKAEAEMTAGKLAVVISGMALVGLAMWCVWSLPGVPGLGGTREKTLIA